MVLSHKIVSLKNKFERWMALGLPEPSRGNPRNYWHSCLRTLGGPSWAGTPSLPHLACTAPLNSHRFLSKARSYPVPQNFGDEARGPPWSVVISPSCDKSCSLKSQVAAGDHSTRHAEQVTKFQTGPHDGVLLFALFLLCLVEISCEPR